jgi:hypothetical protein
MNTLMSGLVSRRREIRISLYSLTAMIIIAGFADLVRGGTSIASFLLSFAYCALIPLAIWFSGDVAPHNGNGRRTAVVNDAPEYRAAIIVGIAILAIYLLTMAPSTAMWDTSEYIAAAYSFGLPHPPGNPLFVIIGHMFSLLPIAGNVAARINVLAAVSSAVAAAFWFLLTEQILRSWISDRWIRIAGGALAALIGGTAFTVWNQSVVNEKVYTVSLTGIGIVSWLAIRWSNDPERASADRLLVMIAYLCGLGYANHMAGMLPAPAVGLMVILRKPATILRARLLVACAFAVFVGLTPFATQPIRAAYFPALNEGEPTACRTKLELKCTFSEGTLKAFMYNFNRGQYGKPALSERQASFAEQVGMWWMYFKWQWLRDPNINHVFPQALLAATFFVLGILGAWIHFQRQRQSFWYFGTLMFTMTLLLIYYLNFKLGASQDPNSQAPHEVRDRDYFFLWSFSAWGVWAAVGLTYIWESIAALVQGRAPDKKTLIEPSRRGWLTASPTVLLAFVPLFGNWTSASRGRHHATRDVAADLLNSVEPYGVLITVGDNDTFPLWYAQEVEGIRKDVVIANTSLLNTDWYGRQLVRRPIYEYDAAKGPAIYRGKQWTKPTSPPIHMTMDELDAIPDYYEVRQPMQFSTGDINAVIDPRNLEYGVLQRADALVLRIIQDSWPSRPVYFARSAAGYPRSLGLGDNVLTQGLASKLFVPPSTAAEAKQKDTILVQGDGWLDVGRSETLWNDVFAGPRSVIDEGQWIDRPSVSMAALYLFMGAELTDALRATGRVAEANTIFATTKQVARATDLQGLIQGFEQQLAAPALQGDSSGVTLRVDTKNQPRVQSTEPRGPRKK